MTFAYTPGLKRKRRSTIRKLRRLPIMGEVLVKKGDYVTETTSVAKALIPTDPIGINVSLHLHCEPKYVPRFMKKTEGDHVDEGEIIAERMQYIWFGKRIFQSPVTGIIEYVSQGTGLVIFRGEPDPLYVNAYIPGRIVEVLPKEGVVVQTQAALIQGIFGIGGETHGELRVLVESNKDALTEDMIDGDCKGKVIVGGSMIKADTIRQAIRVGTKAIIVGGIDHEDVCSILGRQVGVAITGSEKIGTTLVITEGFGEMPMAEKTFELFKDHEGQLVCINGATQIRAGVIRPEIIIPFKEESSEAEPLKEDTEIREEGMGIGTPIRIIAEPYFGLLGVVKSLPVDLKQVETGSLVRVLEAELENGERVIVPRANVELIEE